jgi:sporulation protein YlmC with PRC-barrel domain
MKRSLKKLLEYSIKATDGIKGNVKDFLFDEDKWIIRYLEIDLGTWFKDKKVLIGRTFLNTPEWTYKVFPVNITKSDIEKAPKLEKHLPVSLKYEEIYNKYYNQENYWGFQSITNRILYPQRPIKSPKQELNEKKIDSNLRSYLELENYHVHSKDGMFGHISDLIIDDEDWQIVYAIIDTGNWMPWNKKKVIIPINALIEISYVREEIRLNMNIEQIKNSPVYDESLAFVLNYEESVNNFYINLFK